MKDAIFTVDTLGGNEILRRSIEAGRDEMRIVMIEVVYRSQPLI